MSTVATLPKLKLFPITPCPDLMKILLSTDLTQYTNVIYATVIGVGIYCNCYAKIHHSCKDKGFIPPVTFEEPSI